MANNELKDNKNNKYQVSYTLILSLLLFLFGLLYVWYYLVSWEKKIITKNNADELQSIAQLKLNQIDRWRQERIADANTIKENSFLIKELNNILYGKESQKKKEEIIRWFKVLEKNYQYSNIILFDSNGKIVMSINQKYVKCTSINSVLRSIVNRNEIVFTDFQKDSITNIHLSLLIPLFLNKDNKSTFIGSIALITDPEDFLFPLLKLWPVESKTAESLLLRKEEDSIIFLNRLRHINNIPLQMKISINDTNVLGVKALSNIETVIKGRDYRNKEVIGSGRKIPNTDWFIVAKIDVEEFEAPIKDKLIISIVVTVLFIAGFGITLLLYLSKKHAEYYKRNYDVIPEKHSLMLTFQAIIESSSDMIFSVDNNYRYTSFNQNYADLMKNLYNAEIKLSDNVLECINNEEARDKTKNNIDNALSGEADIEELSLGNELVGYQYYRVKHNSIKDSNDNIVGVSVFAENITEQKRIEDSLVIKNLVFDSSVAANSIIDNNGNITQVNHSFLKLWGYADKNYVIGNSFTEFWNDIAKARAVIKHLSLTGEWHGEYIAKRNDGTIFIAEGVSTKILDTKGNAFGYQFSIFDITERRKAEEALKDSERELKQVQEIAHMGSWYWDVKTGNVKWSEETYKIFRLDPKEFVPQIDSILSLSPWPGDHERGQELIKRAIENHTPGVYEQKFLRPDKSIGYYISTFKGNYDEDNNLISIIGSVMDITERKEAEEALRQSEEKFRSIFESAAVGISITTIEGRIVVNSAYCKILGYSADELLNKTWRDITSPSDIQHDQEIINSILQKEYQSARWKKRYIHKNGNTIWADISTVLLYNSVDEPLYFITSIIDVTSEMRAQEELQKSRERFRRAMENIPDLIVIYDNDLRIQYLNSASKDISGFSSEYFIGKKDEEIWPPEIYEKYLPVLHEAAINKKTTYVESEFVFHNDEKKYLSISCVPVLNENDEILEVIGVTHDNTERKLHEDSIKQRDVWLEYEKTKLRALLDISNGLYFASEFKEIGRTIYKTIKNFQVGSTIGMKLSVYDASEDKYQVVFVSGEEEDSVKNSFLYLPDPCPLEEVKYYSREAINKKDVLFIPDNHSDYSLSIDSRQIELARSSLLFIPLFNGNILIGLISFARAPENSIEEEFKLFLETISKQANNAVGKLLSENKRNKAEKEILKLNLELENRVRERTAKLERANKDLESFSYSVSHDLRAPLRAITGFSQILLNRHKERLNDDGRHYLDNIAEASERMGKLMEDILQYSRLGRRSISFTVVDIKEILQKIISDYENIINSSSSKVVVDSDIPTLESDKTLLNVIFTNLIDNALKYRKKDEPCNIFIVYSSDNKYHYLKIRDNGIGMSTEYKEKIFEVFQRLHSEEEYPGTGIGLAAVKKAAEMLNGSIWLDSSVINEGSTFILKLPKEK